MVKKTFYGGIRYPTSEINMLEKMDFCCEGWINNVSEVVETREDGLAINGCCHGGCFVVQRIKYCPFCGKKIEMIK